MEVIFKKIDTIIEKNYDAVEGYKHALNHVTSPTLKKVFSERQKQREKFHDELVGVMAGYDYKAPEHGTAKGAMHRIFLDVKSTLSSEQQQAAIEECQRGEGDLLEDYKDLLSHNELPTDVRDFIMKQKKALEKTMEELEHLHEIGDVEHSEAYQTQILNPGS